ncbi:FTR1 family iron permease [Rhizobium sp. LjRoot258]|uniref:FTR1 family iron permease n=1 Tax=Rhizobium sp. LjRoot258 TaxID=3342299 RepID=UPI003F507BC3
MTSNLSVQAFGVAFVVWRESFEAMLVVGILSSWASRSSGDGDRPIRWIAGGVAVGIIAAFAMGALLTVASSLLDGEAGEILQMVLGAGACVLMVRMVFWMRTDAERAGLQLASRVRARSLSKNWMGLAGLAALAVAREGAEIVVFLYGLLSAKPVGAAEANVAAGGLGLVLAGLTYWVLRASTSSLPRSLFAAVGQTVLLVLGSGLAMMVIDRAISLGLASPLSGQLWDSRWLLDDTSGVGAFVAGLTGYRSRPELLPLLGLTGYWVIAGFAVAPPRQSKLVAR